MSSSVEETEKDRHFKDEGLTDEIRAPCELNGRRFSLVDVRDYYIEEDDWPHAAVPERHLERQP